MDSIGVVVGNIIPNQAAQMRLTKCDDVIKQLSVAVWKAGRSIHVFSELPQVD
jgi:hypothetical protein